MYSNEQLKLIIYDVWNFHIFRRIMHIIWDIRVIYDEVINTLILKISNVAQWVSTIIIIRL